MEGELELKLRCRAADGHHLPSLSTPRELSVLSTGNEVLPSLFLVLISSTQTLGLARPASESARLPTASEFSVGEA